ncbi:MAG: hypothetical protein ACK514_13190 [Bacteroidota bacterium]|jgi:hypothetical protein|nr:hypothetical protein [Cytophagales bacterium]
MKKYLIIGFIFSASCVLSQTEISFDIEGKRVKDAQTFSIGDSLFVALDWFDQSEVLSLKRGYWINTTGQVTAYEFGFVSRLVLCSVERVSDNGHFYYFLDFSKKKKNFTSLGVFFSQSTDLKSVARLNDEIEISGDYIGATSSLEGITLFFF